MAAVLLIAVPAPAGQPWIETRAELDTWLAAEPADSPLRALSPGARERFLYSLRFGNSGVDGADGGDLADELGQEQIHALLALFGPEVARQAPASLREEVRTLERNVRRREVIGELERRYNDYFKAVHDIGAAEGSEGAQRRGKAFDDHIGELYTAKSLSRADDRELRLLRRAAEDRAVETHAPRHVEAFRAVFLERERRRLVSSGDLETMQSLFLSQRRVADARRLHEKYPGSGLTPLPTFRDPLGKSVGGTTAWRLDASGRRLTREVVDLSSERILVTASALASREVLRAIRDDPRLFPVFERHASWLAQPPGIESLAAAREWNREFSATPILLIHDRAEWALLPRWRVPEFYLVRDGRVVDSFSGWQSGSAQHLEGLRALLERNGFLRTPD